MLVSVSPMFTLAGFAVLAGIFFTAKTFFDGRMAALANQTQAETTEGLTSEA